MAAQPEVQVDPDGRQIVIKVIDPSTGTLVPGYDTITISLFDVMDLGFNKDGKNRNLSIQWLYFRDTSCNYMRSLVLMSDPEPDPTNGGTVTPPAH